MSKRDVEILLDTYDADPVAALTRALAIALDDVPVEGRASTFDELVARGAFDTATTSALFDRDVRTMDRLVQSLNELRGLA